MSNLILNKVSLRRASDSSVDWTLNSVGTSTSANSDVLSITNRTGAVKLKLSDAGLLETASVKTGNVTFTDGTSLTTAPVPVTPPVTSVQGKTGAVTITGADITSALGFSVPSITGTGASGTWGISISGNAATATQAGSATNAVNLSGSIASGVVATTQALNDSSTKVATTAFVTNQAATVLPALNGTAAIGTSKKYAREDHSHPGGVPTILYDDDITVGTEYTVNAVAGRPVQIFIQYSGVQGGRTSVSVTFSWGLGALSNIKVNQNVAVDYVVMTDPSLMTFLMPTTNTTVNFKIDQVNLGVTTGRVCIVQY